MNSTDKNLEELKQLINERYAECDLTFLDSPVPFCKMFKDKSYDMVQVYSSQVIDFGDGKKNIVGFSGVFKWEDNKLISLDGDTYSEKYEVIGYETWANEAEGVKSGLSIWI